MFVNHVDFVMFLHVCESGDNQGRMATGASSHIPQQKDSLKGEPEIHCSYQILIFILSPLKILT